MDLFPFCLYGVRLCIYIDILLLLLHLGSRDSVKFSFTCQLYACACHIHGGFFCLSLQTFALLSGVHSIVSCYLKRLRGKEDGKPYLRGPAQHLYILKVSPYSYCMGMLLC